MRVRVVSDGRNTSVIDTATGKPLKYVRGVKINLTPNAINRAELEFVGVELDLIVQAELAKTSRKFLNNIRKEMEKIEREELD